MTFNPLSKMATVPLLKKSLSAYSERNNAIAENIANVETKGYRPYKVEFEYQVLLSFINNVNRELSRDQILMIVSGRNWNPSDRSVDVVVGKLRRKLRKSPDEPLLIKTIRTKGYKFTATVKFE